MSLWIFQSIVNLLLINAALFWLLSRKQTKFLEAQVDRLEREIEILKSRSTNSTESQVAAAVSILTEKKIAPVAVSANAISPAQELAAVKEQKPVAEQTLSKSSSATTVSNVTYSHPVRSTQSASTVSVFSSSGTSSLVEKQSAPSNSKNGSKEAFEKASMMLSSGANVKEISRVTGLSLAELQLMNKFATRVQ
jgi:tRNA U34 5-carboxymethylaminomethyl modifying enzyme MnmG/GidA